MDLFSIVILCGCFCIGAGTVIATGLTVYWVSTGRYKSNRGSVRGREPRVAVPRYLGTYLVGVITKVAVEPEGKANTKGHPVEVKLPYGEILKVIVPFKMVDVTELQIGRSVEFLFNPNLPPVQIVHKFGEEASGAFDPEQSGQFMVEEYRTIDDFRFKD